ncbi:MAG: hypothetical protein R3335_10135, partial [Anaerolineales bacterium]|nr:hypothetical protein [Anaerolineales bacterium]
NADGTGHLQLTTYRFDETPDWSPDGSQILFVTRSGLWPTVVNVMNADGSDIKLVFDTNPGSPYSASWSADGSQIVFNICDTRSTWGVCNGGDIFIMDADGYNDMLLAENAYRPAWRPQP